MDKVLFATIVLTGFISISVLGIFLMPYDGSHHDTACFASLVNNVQSPCPEDDPIGFANFHSDALKKVASLTLIDSWAAWYAIATMIILAFSSASILSADKFSLEQLKFSQSKILADNYFLSAIWMAWFSLHENSPSYY